MLMMWSPCLMFCMASSPLVTRPKTLYWPSNWGCAAQRDVELTAVGVGAGVGHGQHARGVVLERADFIVELVAGTAGAVALGVAALDDEAGHHAVEGQAVEVSRRGPGRTKLFTVLGASFTARLMTTVPLSVFIVAV